MMEEQSIDSTQSLKQILNERTNIKHHMCRDRKFRSSVKYISIVAKTERNRSETNQGKQEQEEKEE